MAQVISNSRPDTILAAYWREVLVIEENAEWFPVEYREG